VSPSRDDKLQFWANFDIWGSYTQPSPMRAEFGVPEQTHSLLLHAKFQM